MSDSRGRAIAEIRSALAELDLESTETAEGLFSVRLPGTAKLITECALEVGRHGVSVRAFVARRLADESLAAGVKRLETGKGTTFEVLELQKKLAQAQAAEVQALSDFNTAVSKFERLTGTSLRNHNVVIENPKP